MSNVLTKYDAWLEDTGPAALVIREYLVPVEGHDGVVFPATFAAGDGFPGGYNIDEFPDGTNVCLIDSVGSQANRIEPLFARGGYAGLVPQIVIKAGEKRVNLLEAGHRAGDAIVRCSGLKNELQSAFKAERGGNVEPLARIAPTSLVFGVWDSRDTQSKRPRLLSSTIRAFNVRKLTRRAQYVPAVEYQKQGLVPDPEELKVSEKAYGERGFSHVPVTKQENTHGGVIATGGIRRDATLHIAALRLLTVDHDKEKTLALRRYLLGLALTAFTYSPIGYLRQGCNLVLDPDKKGEFKVVSYDGRREDVHVKHEDALAYAKAAAKEFGIDPQRKIDLTRPPDREVEFDKELAKKDVAGDEAGVEGKKAKGKKAK